MSTIIYVRCINEEHSKFLIELLNKKSYYGIIICQSEPDYNKTYIEVDLIGGKFELKKFDIQPINVKTTDDLINMLDEYSFDIYIKGESKVNFVGYGFTIDPDTYNLSVIDKLVEGKNRMINLLNKNFK